MANPPRTRKRVHAIPRAPDGSAFQKCDDCGVSVPIAVADMHECKGKKDFLKRFKGICGRQYVMKQSSDGQPISPFRLFMESFTKSCKTENWVDVDREGFETWKKMSTKERLPYVIRAEKVNSAYAETLLEEMNCISEVDDEADSAMVGKFDQQYYQGFESSEDRDSFDTFESKRLKDSYNEWLKARSWTS